MQDSRTKPEQVGENFPVASQLLPQKWRKPVLNFYAFARGMDDISDHPQLSREEKRDQLRVIRLGLEEKQPDILPKWVQPYYRMVERGSLSAEHGKQLWQAFWQDTEKQRYRTMDEVLAYCRLSAAPVGRAVLEITRQPAADTDAADALCIALQLINHLQDVRSDYLQRQRIYLPQHWLERAGLSEKVLEKAETGPKLRGVFNQWLDEVDRQLKLAEDLPRSIYHRGLRWELQIILAYARALAKKLRRDDPMAHRVRLSGFRKLILSLTAIAGWA